MRRLRLVVILFLIFGGGIPLKSQVLSNLEFGANLGTSLGTVAIDYTDFSKLKPGYTYGIYARYAIADPLSVSLGLNFSLQGAKEIDPFLLYSEQSPLVLEENRMDLLFNSLSLPLLFNVLINPESSLGLKVIAGSSVNFLNKARTLSYNQTKIVNDMPYQTTNDVTDRVKRTTYMGIIGVGTQIDADPIIIGADLTYQMGLRNINNVIGNPYFYSNQIVLSISIGYGL